MVQSKYSACNAAYNIQISDTEFTCNLKNVQDCFVADVFKHKLMSM